ncbi:MAG TPA: hypothetical protein VMS86_01065, partial [Thermoanaerobaculia bacterium]|nr:hypothetical protein [Thermoanaerobaculia bacterium]
VLFTFLLTLGALGLVRFFDQERLGVLAAAGLVLGLATLTRSVLQVYPPVFAVLALVGLRRRPAARRLAAIAVFVACFSLPVAPWVVRNSLLHGRPTPVDTTAERVLRPRLESLATGEAGERQRLGRPGPLAGLAAIPAQALLFWRVDRELAAAAARGWLGPLPGAMVVALGVAIGGYYAALLLAGLCGAILQPPRPIHLAVVLSFVVAICGAHALTFGHSRYHIPLMPLVALFAARLVVAGPGRPTRRRVAAAAGGVLLLLGSWTLNLVREDLPELRQGLEGSLRLPRYHARE